MTIKAHQVLLTDSEWEEVYKVYPKGIPVIHPALLSFAAMSKEPESIIEGTSVYREMAWECRCWMCEHMLSQPVITGYHLYVVMLNRITSGGNPRHQLN